MIKMEGRDPDEREVPLPSTEASIVVRDSNISEKHPGARRPPPETSPSSPATRAQANARQYMFVDQQGNRSSSNEAVRVHAMRESHRAKRQLRGLQQSGGQQTLDDMTILQAPRNFSSPGRTTVGVAGLEMDADDERAIADDLAMSNARSLADLKRLAGPCEHPQHC